MFWIYVAIKGSDFSEQKEFAIRYFVGDITVDGLNIIKVILSLGLENSGVGSYNVYCGFVNETVSIEAELS